MIAINQQILLNGRYHSGNSAILTIQNRAFAYGDCLTETIHACASRLCFFNEHIENLRNAMKLAEMEIPTKFNEEIESWKSEISKMLVKNKVFKGANIRIIVYRADSENFFTKNDNVEYIVCAEPLNQTGFEFNKQGLYISIYDKIKKYNDEFAKYNTHQNAFLRTLAAKQAYRERINDTIILNQDKNVVETALHGNIYIVKNDTIYTPSLSDGATDDIIRTKILETAKSLNYKTDCQSSISEDFAMKADEMFVASTENGINWIGAFKSRRFYHTVSGAIAQKINDLYLETEE